MTPHTPLPWRVEIWDYSHATPPRKELNIQNEQILIAKMEWAGGYENPYVVQDEEAKANAQLIITAVHAHHAMKEALEATLHSLKNWMEIADEDDQRDYDARAVQLAEAALDLAKGEEESTL